MLDRADQQLGILLEQLNTAAVTAARVLANIRLIDGEDTPGHNIAMLIASGVTRESALAGLLRADRRTKQQRDAVGCDAM
jgi:hypothetical protein